jgi:hypothetical protein
MNDLNSPKPGTGQLNIKPMRRIRLDLQTPAEAKIREAIAEVEKTGADEKLTQAITHLSKAQELVADYIDENLKKVFNNQLNPGTGPLNTNKNGTT